MKNTIKLFAALTIILAFGVTAIAQNNASAIITGTANVASAIGVTTDGGLVFGNVTPGNTKTVSNVGTVIAGTIAGSLEREGRFIVAKGASTQVTLGIATPTQLVSGTDNLAINFVDAGTVKLAKISDGTNNTDFTPAAGIITANSGTTAWAFLASTFKVHVGGTVVPTATQKSGTYTGDITLTATYN